MAQTQITRQVAGEAREFARANGLSVGTRGRISQEVFTTFFLSKPSSCRTAAKALDIPVSRRGRISPVDATKVALAVR